MLFYYFLSVPSELLFRLHTGLPNSSNVFWFTVFLKVCRFPKQSRKDETHRLRKTFFPAKWRTLHSIVTRKKNSRDEILAEISVPYRRSSNRFVTWSNLKYKTISTLCGVDILSIKIIVNGLLMNSCTQIVSCPPPRNMWLHKTAANSL